MSAIEGDNPRGVMGSAGRGRDWEGGWPVDQSKTKHEAQACTVGKTPPPRFCALVPYIFSFK